MSSNSLAHLLKCVPVYYIRISVEHICGHFKSMSKRCLACVSCNMVCFSIIISYSRFDSATILDLSAVQTRVSEPKRKKSKS